MSAKRFTKDLDSNEAGERQKAHFLELLNSEEGVQKLAEQGARYLRGALAAQRALRFDFPGLYFGIHLGDFSEEAIAKQNAEEAKMAEEYRYAVYPLDSEKHRCFTCGGPTFIYHKCRWCRGEY